MSKSNELRILRSQRSVDAPVNVRGRTGESADVGTMLDLYVQVESAEDEAIGKIEEYERERFVKGFSMYLEKVFDESERDFLREIIGRTGSVEAIVKRFRVSEFKVLEKIQEKAYANTKPLVKLAKLTGWSGAAGFLGTVFERLAQLRAGDSINAILPDNVLYLERRRKIFAYNVAYTKKWRENNRERYLQNRKDYYAQNKAKVQAWSKAWKEKYFIKNRDSYNQRYKESGRKQLHVETYRLKKKTEAFTNAMEEWIEAGRPLEGAIFKRLKRAEKSFNHHTERLRKLKEKGEKKRVGEQDVDAGRVALGMVRDIQGADVGSVQLAEH